MKQITNKVGNLLFIIALFVMSSCEKDFENYKITNSNNNIIIEDFSILRNGPEQKNSKLFNALNKLKEKNKQQIQKSLGKIVYNSLYDFYFDDENGKYINVNGKISYTFPVSRDSTNNKVENIVFNLNEDNEYDVLLIKYGFTKEKLFTLTEEEIKNFDLQIINIQSKFQQDCGVNVIMCNNNGMGGTAENAHVAGPGCHHAGNGIHLFVVWNPGDCADGSVILDGSGGGGGGASSGGGGTSSNPVITVPVVPCVGCVEQVDPCTSLSNILNPLIGNARQKILAVQNAGEGFSGEKGATFTYSNGAYGSSPILSSTGSNSNAYGINFPPSPTIYAAVHTHQDDDSQTPMFSFNDLMYLVRLYREASTENQPNVTFILTLPNSSTFAIKINNFESFKNFLNSILMDPDVNEQKTESEKVKMRNKIFHNKCCSGCNPGNTSTVGINYNDRFIAGFLTSTKNYGVSLYRATGNITNWEKLIAPANSSDTNYTTAPCNN
jgi:hypothetical protein